VSKYKLNASTFLEGLTVGILNTFILFELNKKSILLASLWSATFILGTVISLYVKFDNPKIAKLLTFLARILILPILLFETNSLSIAGIFLLGLIQAIFSRKIFIQLKEYISEIDINHLTAHGSINAVGYGLGSVLSGFLNEAKMLFILISLITISLTYILKPCRESLHSKDNLGISRRDLYIASVFTFSTTPLNNTLGLLIYANIFNEEIAALGALVFNIGSILSYKLKVFISKTGKPIAFSLLISSLIYISTLYIGFLPYFFISRLVIGSFLYAAQGLLEERSKKGAENNDKGLEHLWQIFSLFSFLSLLILPSFGERFGYLILGLISLTSSFILIIIKRVIK
jgi:hypothetical protein